MTYDEQIIDALQGTFGELQKIPKERLDWSGCGAVLNLYDETSGKDRAEFIRAMGRIIQADHVASVVKAQVVHIASSMDIAEVEPSVKGLQKSPAASEEPLKTALENYLAFRKLAHK